MDKLLSVTEWAEKNGRDVSNTRRMLREGRLEGFKVGNGWVIPEDAQPAPDKRIKSGKYIKKEEKHE